MACLLDKSVALHQGGTVTRHAGKLPSGEVLEGREGIERRRAFVMECRLKGLKVEAIATILDVHRNTVTNDIKAISRRQAEVVRGIDSDASIGETIEFYDFARDRAMLEYAQALSEGGKVAFLQAAIKATEMKAKLLMDSGVIPKAARSGTNGASAIFVDGEEINDDDIDKMTIPELLSYRGKLQDKISMWGESSDSAESN
jgi:hypothetical protein